MLSPTQKQAIRSVVVAVLGDAPTGIPELAPAAIYWGPTNLPALPPVYCAIAMVGTELLGLDHDRQYEVVPADPLADPPTERQLYRVTRKTYAVSVATTIVVRQNDAAPSHLLDAAVLMRRLDLGIDEPEHQRTLNLAGCPILRRGTARDVGRIARATQETRQELTIVVGLASIRRTAVGWIETVEGEGTVLEPGGSSTVLPFEAES
jgi:hypothetical protein